MHPEAAAREGYGPAEFRRLFFPRATLAQWNDWRWQLRNRIRDLQGLERILRLSAEERAAVERHSGALPVGITPYYASLLSATDARQPLRRTVVMVGQELERTAGEAEDPLAEERDSPVPGLVHRYPDRALLMATNCCPVYCRYCTRSRLVGLASRREQASIEQWKKALQYIDATPAIRDVVISGGDPLVLSEDRLEWLLSRLRRIPHVEILRIGSKTPAALPQRITPALVRMLKQYHPLWMSLHFTHPDELTPETARACARLANAGIPLGSQTVLLRGINDDVHTMRRLFQGLLRMRVRPYYLYQCDVVSGSAQFRTSVQKGLEIIQGLRGHTTGYAVPTYVIDLPGGGGKVSLVPGERADGKGDMLLRNYKGELFGYPDAAWVE